MPLSGIYTEDSRRRLILGYAIVYGSIGMPDENYRNCIEAFRTLGNYGRNTQSPESEET